MARCAACGTENPVVDRFSMHCGGQLAGAAAVLRRSNRTVVISLHAGEPAVAAALTAEAGRVWSGEGHLNGVRWAEASR